LAERLGCTVSELLVNISSEELTEWIAYFKILNEEQKEEERKQKNNQTKRRR